VAHLWLDNQAGLDLFVEMLPVLMVARFGLAYAAVTVVDDFVGGVGDGQRPHVNMVTAVGERRVLGGTSRGHRLDVGEIMRRAAEIGMGGLAVLDRDALLTNQVVGGPEDRRAAVHFLRAQSQAMNHNDDSAVAELRIAATTTESSRLRRAVGAAAQATARRLLWADCNGPVVSTSVGLAAAQLSVEMRPDNDFAWCYYAGALESHGRLDDALAAIDRSLELAPGNSNAHNDRGVTLGRAGRLDEALAAFDRAVELNPSFGGAEYNRGVTLNRSGRLDEALAAFDRAIEIDADNIAAHSGRGSVLCKLGRFNDALAVFDGVAELDPSDHGLHGNKGILLVALGDLDGALDELITAERLDAAGAGEANAWAGAILWHRGQVDEAKARFSQVEGRVTGCTPFGAAEMEAVALCGLGRVDEAERRLREAVPSWVPGDAFEPREIYELLVDPPLPGIERLRAIVDGTG
jgi:tetratricopeptide (TPR) repeat protein